MPSTKRLSVAAGIRSVFSPRWRRTNQVGLAALATVALLPAAVAQELSQAQADAEEITVTGSRLRRDGMSSPTPVTALEITEIRQMAPTLLMDSLDQLPQFRDNALSQTGSIFTSGGGSNAVNLRGIGTNRTLLSSREYRRQTARRRMNEPALGRHGQP